MQVSPGSPRGPALSRACVSPPTVLPPTTPCVPAQVHHGWGPHTRIPGQVWGYNTMAFSQGSDVTGGYRSCPAVQCGTTVTSDLTTTYPVTTGSEPRWHGAESTGGWRYTREPRVSLWPSPVQGTHASLYRVSLHKSISWGPRTGTPSRGLRGNGAPRPGEGPAPNATVLTAPGLGCLPLVSAVL